MHVGSIRQGPPVYDGTITATNCSRCVVVLGCFIFTFANDFPLKLDVHTLLYVTSVPSVFYAARLHSHCLALSHPCQVCLVIVIFTPVFDGPGTPRTPTPFSKSNLTFNSARGFQRFRGFLLIVASFSIRLEVS